MKTLRYVGWFLLCVLLAGPPMTMAQPGGSPRDSQEKLESLLNELQDKIDDADKRMIAHPRFLGELRDLVDRYRAELKEVFLYDDFADRDYTRNPKWVVKAGQFKITPAGRLWNRVPVERPSPVSSSPGEEVFGLIFKEMARDTQKKGRTTNSATTTNESIIQTWGRIGASFEIDLSFVSKSAWGAMEVALLGGEPPAPRYRLIYQAAASKDRPIEIVRQRGQRQYTIESAARYPVLDDGKLHRLQWLRDAQGVMQVLVDGREVLSTVELFYRDEFAGLRLVNRGGIYEWGPILVQQTQEVNMLK